MKRRVFLLSPLAACAAETELRARTRELMKRHNVPGISLAFARGGRVVWAEGFGVVAANGARQVDRDTVFQAASISKPVAAMAALHMSQYGHFTLDENVNTRLSSWKVPDNDFTAQQKVTLRRLLSHTAGLSVHGFPGYAAGQPLPSITNILDGEKPANTAPVRVVIEPGHEFRYSGGGYTVVQLLMTERMRKPFPELMRMIVLGPLRMTRSTFDQPLTGNWHANAAQAHRRDGQPYNGRCHVYPEMAAAGLWTTPTDLLTWAAELRRAARGESARVLQRATAEAMVTPVLKDYGLGVGLVGAGAAARFGHGGSNAGFRCKLSMQLSSGDGYAIMINSDAGDKLGMELDPQLQSELGWTDTK